jgi:hypothetical protein
MPLFKRSKGLASDGVFVSGSDMNGGLDIPVVTSSILLTEILSLPSKRVALLASDGSFIARSDSNGEDQEGFAGAGLYDSIPVPEASEHLLDYTTEKLYWDKEVRFSQFGERIGTSSVPQSCPSNGKSRIFLRRLS